MFLQCALILDTQNMSQDLRLCLYADFTVKLIDTDTQITFGVNVALE